MPNIPNNRHRITAQKAAQWLLAHGGLSNKQLGQYLGKSGGWIHHLAKGNWRSGISVTPEHARWLLALRRIMSAQGKASRDELTMIESIKVKLGEVIGDVDNLARRIGRRKTK